MNAGKTHQQVVEECAYAVACCVDHYHEEGLSDEGLKAVRNALMTALFPRDTGLFYSESNRPGMVEFRDRIIFPPHWIRPEFYWDT